MPYDGQVPVLAVLPCHFRLATKTSPRSLHSDSELYTDPAKMTLLDADDTIVAIASPTSPAPRGVVRMSGDKTVTILKQMGVHCEEIKIPRRLATHVDL